MTHLTKTAAAAALALVVSVTASAAQESGQSGEAGQGEATTFDMDRNPDTGEAAFEDFSTGFDTYGGYDRWDADADSTLTREELARGLFDTYDLDRSGTLSDEEIVGMQNDRLFSDEALNPGGAEQD